MAKRKRDPISGGENGAISLAAKKTKANGQGAAPALSTLPLTVQIVAGSYDRVLHGVSAAIAPEGDAEFADTFLFNAHTSAIRCIALSPPSAPIPGQGQKVMLASGSTDERINIYNLSAHPPRKSADQDLISSLAARPVAESSKNRELGSLLNHSSTITRLTFPTRSKLLSSSEDSTIAVTRTRDWSLLSSIKAPVPMAHGRPSGDTAAMGGTPSGVNDFAIHPSMKLMVSVSKGEKCMRLWNLVTGKKAGVLNFGRQILEDAGEGKHSTGEGWKAVWGSCGGEDEFAVGFDRNIIVFGMDSRPKCKIMPDARNKVHEFRYVKVDGENDATVLAVATEDSRILFFSTRLENTSSSAEQSDKKSTLPAAVLVAQLGGRDAGVSGRIKDFTILPVAGDGGDKAWLVVTGGSDGKIRVWHLGADDLRLRENDEVRKQVGRLRGTYETQNRITCVDAFVMIPRPEGLVDSEDDLDEESDNDSD